MKEHALAAFRDLAESPTMKISAQAKGLIENGHDVINLTAGEPDFAPPQTAIDALAKAMAKDASVFRYGPAAGMPGLRAAVKEQLKTERGLDVGDVGITHGGKGALFMALFTASPYDKPLTVMKAAPYWPSYRPIVEGLGHRFVPMHTKASEGYKVTPDLLEFYLKKYKPDFVIEASPDNPTSVFSTRQEIEERAEVYRRYDTQIISDNIYSYWVHSGEKFVDLAMAAPDLQPRIVICDAFSKSMALTGLRVGYAAGPKEFMKSVMSAQSHYLGNANRMGQTMALGALNGSQDYRDVWEAAFERRAASAVEILQTSPLINVSMPGGGIYCYPDLSKVFRQNAQVPKGLPLFKGLEKEAYQSMAGEPIKDTGAMGRYMLAHFGLAVIPGTDCEDPNGIRMGIAASDDHVKEGARRFVQAVNSLKLG